MADDVVDLADSTIKPGPARDRIIAAAIEFLWDRPYRELTAGELMQRTGLSRPAFYQYFRNVNDLVTTLLEDLLTAMVEAAGPWFASDENPIEDLRTSLSGVAGVCQTHGPVFRAVVEAAPLDAELEQAWSAFMTSWDESVATRIRSQQELGLVDARLDPDRIARTFNQMDAAVLVEAFGRRPQADLDEVVDALHMIWTRTLYGSIEHFNTSPGRR